MRSLILTALFAASAAFATPAAAEQGKIVWVDPSCSYFIAQLGEEYGIYQWRAGSTPDEGDIMDGKLRAEGTVEEIQNATKGSANTVIPVALSPTLRSLINSSPVNCKKRYQKQQ
jgi:hypothetical protein